MVTPHRSNWRSPSPEIHPEREVTAPWLLRDQRQELPGGDWGHALPLSCPRSHSSGQDEPQGGQLKPGEVQHALPWALAPPRPRVSSPCLPLSRALPPVNI